MLDVITIDGPAASGKSTIGLQFAQKNNYRFIDSGAFFRAGCLLIIRQNLPLENEDQNAQIFHDLKLTFEIEDNKEKILLNGEDITVAMHAPEIGEKTSMIATQAKVRAEVRQMQRDLVAQQPSVVAGRDIGTEIFPEAKLKFFITASDEVRAERRFKQLQKKGSEVTYEEILQQTRDRDYRDAHRAISPMKVPEDAIVIDTSSISIEDAVKKMEEVYQTILNSPQQ